MMETEVPRYDVISPAKGSISDVVHGSNSPMPLRVTAEVFNFSHSLIIHITIVKLLYYYYLTTFSFRS